MINDVRRAYFYAKITRDVYIELPKEGPKYGTGLLGKLKRFLYGTRDVAKGWHETLCVHISSELDLSGAEDTHVFSGTRPNTSKF